LAEKLIVKNFGPIKHVELDIKKVNVLIGEQGTGKSALVRLLNLFNSEGFLFGSNEDREKLIDLYGFFFKDSTYFEYKRTEYTIIFDKRKFTISYTGVNKDILDRFRTISNTFFKEHDLNVAEEYYSLKKWFVTNIGDCNYIPAERIAVTTLSQRRGDKGNLDQYIIDFQNYFLQSTKIKELKIPFLKNVIYRREDNKDIVILNGEQLFLYQTSSGFQSSIPLSVTVDYFSTIKEKIRFIIEEPELNLFPETQNELMKYLVEKTSADKNGLFLATHSPYTLTSLNNLMYAYSVGQKYTAEVSQKVNQKYWLNPADVSAYMLKSDGSCEDIFDHEEDLIKAEKIDQVSSLINKIFNELLNIEFNNDEPDSK
jgi:predicted ATPase